MGCVECKDEVIYDDDKRNISSSHDTGEFKWVKCFANGHFPPNAVEGGYDIDGSKIYVGRVSHNDDWIPAKVIPNKEVAYVSYGGREHSKSSFEVLVQKSFSWVNTSGSNIPRDAVVGGQTSDGEALYVGRACHDGAQTVGKVHPSHGCLYVPFDGEERQFSNYEILVYN